ncbi:183_t:CDS:2, partial [Gigaspora margarita]
TQAFKTKTIANSNLAGISTNKAKTTAGPNIATSRSQAQFSRPQA